ncbi:MAG TPA: hypothetical protein ENH50_02385 [Nitrospirae bacterium]|nr:hypothetical protein BMS3Abin08_00032 [bacterium BMS3Abin08]HDY70495.1 hypothetical protein [Nitrospirota bacterium]
MCKFIKRMICLLVLIAVAIGAVAFLEGGDPFRWLGRRSEETGKVIREKSDKLADEADKIKRTTRDVKKEVDVVKRKTEEFLKKKPGNSD